MVKANLSKLSNRNNYSAKSSSAFVSPELSGRIVKVAAMIETVAPGTLDSVKGALMSKGSDIVASSIKAINSGKVPSSYKFANTSPNPAYSYETAVFEGSKTPTGNISYALSGAPEPKKVVLNSGIRPDTFVSDYMPPIENVCSPLHLSIVQLAMPTSVTNPMSSYFTNNIVFNIQSKAQQASTFLLDVTSSTGFTAPNITAAINDGIYALQVYFYYSSLLAYESNSKNKNSGMDHLRTLIDGQTLADYNQLGKRLEDTPMPPKLVEWVRYMSNNFKSGDNAGSPIIKTTFHPAAILGTPVSSYCKIALTNLSRNNNLGVWTLMRKALPKWRIGKLYDIPTTPSYDKQFITIFANLSNTNRANSILNYPGLVPNLNTAIAYNSFTNNLDGMAYSMSNVNIGTERIPGIVDCLNATPTWPDTRYSFYSVAGVQNFYPVYLHSFLGMSRQETYAQHGNTAHAPHLSGSDKCQNVTGAALCNSAQEVLDFMFETKTTLKLGVANTFRSK